jgi:hypothetical protein
MVLRFYVGHEVGAGSMDTGFGGFGSYKGLWELQRPPSPSTVIVMKQVGIRIKGL